jgi:hypothetical protein
MLVNTQDPPDGSNIPRRYEEILKETELAEAVGFDSVFVSGNKAKGGQEVP